MRRQRVHAKFWISAKEQDCSVLSLSTNCKIKSSGNSGLGLSQMKAKNGTGLRQWGDKLAKEFFPSVFHDPWLTSKITKAESCSLVRDSKEEHRPSKTG
jgi:hypothetical protein